ncbi:MAG TPA: vitamin K epoxide reductase family protein [Candidatus Saccharimonadales bacterium]|nr:vitamin K epoxide reductase family protein [Candidatus Saccharimonadales bacterium]
MATAPIDTDKPTKADKSQNKWFWIFGTVFSLVGLADSIYLTIAHYTTSAILACPETKFINCAKVTTSSYSEIFGIPVPLFGLVFFVGMLLFQLPKSWQSKSLLIKRCRVLLSIAGLISVFYFIYVELHLLHSICIFCTLVHILTFAIFVNTVIGTSVVSDEQ